jgi:hypothetical protein
MERLMFFRVISSIAKEFHRKELEVVFISLPQVLEVEDYLYRLWFQVRLPYRIQKELTLAKPNALRDRRKLKIHWIHHGQSSSFVRDTSFLFLTFALLAYIAFFRHTFDIVMSITFLVLYSR